MSERRQGRAQLIVIEGIDGAGKSTLSRALATNLQQLGLSVRLASQPTAYATGIRVRKLARANASREALTQALILDRRAQYYKVLRPAFRNAHVIICDRYFYSSVYQSTSIAHLRSQIAFYRRNLPIPDITFVLLPTPFEARKRILMSGRKLDRFEQNIARYHRLYLSLRSYRETAFLSSHEPLVTLVKACSSQILAKCKVPYEGG